MLRQELGISTIFLGKEPARGNAHYTMQDFQHGKNLILFCISIKQVFAGNIQWDGISHNHLEMQLYNSDFFGNKE